MMLAQPNVDRKAKVSIPYPSESKQIGLAENAAAAADGKLSTGGPESGEQVSATSTATTPYVPKEEYESELEFTGTNVNDNPILPDRKSTVSETTHIWELIPLDSIPPEGNILDHDIRLLHSAAHDDPFAILGPHQFSISNGEEPHLVIRAWVKDSASVKINIQESSTLKVKESGARWFEMIKHNNADWLHQIAFSVKLLSDDLDNTSSLKTDFLKETQIRYTYKVSYHGDTSGEEFALGDAYNIGLILPEYDLKLFQSGSCWHVDNLMGSHVCEMEEAGECKSGVRFAVWAPNATSVSVVGDFNQWDGRAHPMRRRHEFGVYELFVPTIPQVGHKYGYQIKGAGGSECVKIDPYAQSFENPPAHASIISACDDPYKPKEDRFQWTDSKWMTKRAHLAKEDEIRRMPMSIYEVHLPSWMRGDNNSYLSYRELAHRLVEHMKLMNFTHIEFLPVCQHPFEKSWGYQVSGLYAPYSRLGSADDLKFLVNYLHEHDIGVFIDFVPAHFVKDDWGLIHYDGSPCYEYGDPREGEHKGWGTMIFNFRRNEVRSFLLGAAYHWLRRYHIDGMRIDAVSAMLYKNYCREPGDWIPNEHGGEANLEAITLLQEMNYVIHREFPGVFMMAEEATSWAGVSDKERGLGFDAKWDLGWMNDTLTYLCNPPTMRKYCHNLLTFRGLYVAHERWVLPLSHDEVVSGKGSILDKCGFTGSPFNERLCTLRTLFGYQIGLQGRPLVFMGAEFGQGREWTTEHSLDWHEARETQRQKTLTFLSDLLAIYRENKCLHAGDDDPWNFMWVDCDNAEDNLVAWIRKWQEWNNDVLVVCNFSGNYYRRYPFGVPHGGSWQVLITSDDWKYGGDMRGPGNNARVETTQGGRLGWPYCLWIDVPPFTCIYFKAPSPKPRETPSLPGTTTDSIEGLQIAPIYKDLTTKSKENIAEIENPNPSVATEEKRID